MKITDIQEGESYCSRPGWEYFVRAVFKESLVYEVMSGPERGRKCETTLADFAKRVTRAAVASR